MSLQKSIAALAEVFAASVVKAIQTATLEEVVAEGNRYRGVQAAPAAPAKRGPGRPVGTQKQPNVAVTRSAPVAKAPLKKGGRLARRSEADLQKVAGTIVSALKQAPEGLRSEHLQRVLKLSKKELVGPLSLALEGKKISKKGQRRSTTYFAK